MENKTELKPCPFCGAEAVITTVEPHVHKIASFTLECDGETFIECTGCSCGVSEKTEKEAAEAWNRRADNG